MNRLLRILSILAGTAAAGGASGFLVVGCGSSSSSSGTDSGTDGTSVSPQGDATPDSMEVADGPPNDGGGEPSGETGTTNGDGGGPDGSADGSTGTADAGDAGLTAEGFPSQFATAYCSTIAACCGTTGDAATFNWENCYLTFLPRGYNSSAVGANLIDGGHVTFDQAQAQSCLNAIATTNCATNQFTSQESTQLYQSCYAAYSGTQPTDATCASSIECVSGDYCLPGDAGAADGGVLGTCKPLAGDGGACGVLSGQANAQSACSYRGSGANGLFCKNISGDAGLTQLPSSEWTCQPQWPNGSECYADQDCTSNICHEVSAGVYQCSSAGQWANAATCSFFMLTVDAGGGG